MESDLYRIAILHGAGYVGGELLLSAFDEKTKASGYWRDRVVSATIAARLVGLVRAL